MEKKRKKESHHSDKVVEKIDEDVTFVSFFQSCLVRGKVKFWQEKEIQVFFKGLGLKDKEPTSIYREALEKY